MTEKKKTRAGRPTKYKSQYCQEIEDFFDVEAYTDVPLNHYDKDGNVKWTDFKRTANPFPTLVKFARKIKVSYSTVHRWQNEKDTAFQPEFQKAYMRAKELQKEFIIENGLNGCYNAAFAKFVAINVTDMVDTPAIDNSKHYTIHYGYRDKPANSSLRPKGREGESAQPSSRICTELGRQDQSQKS